jgi:hypothetical protein
MSLSGLKRLGEGDEWVSREVFSGQIEIVFRVLNLVAPLHMRKDRFAWRRGKSWVQLRVRGSTGLVLTPGDSCPGRFHSLSTFRFVLLPPRA